MENLLRQFGINYDLYSGLFAWGLIMSRTLAMIIVTPFLGGKGVPGRVKFLLAVVISLYVFFLLQDETMSQLPAEKSLLLALFFKEIFFGLVIGLTTVMTFYAIDAGGRIIDNQRGSANAQIFVPQLGQVTIFGLFAYWLGIVIFIGLSGHVIFLQAFVKSFQIVPVMHFPTIEPGFSPFLVQIIRMSADVLILGVQMATPVLIAIFLTDLVLGIANKMAPQIPVFELGFVLKGVVGVAMVWVSVKVLAVMLKEFFIDMNQNVESIILLFQK